MKVASTDQSGATADEIAPTAAMNSTVVRVELLLMRIMYIHNLISTNFRFPVYSMLQRNIIVFH